MKKRDKASMIYESLEPMKRYCKCGHSLYIMRGTKRLCEWCGYYVYNTEQDEFREKLQTIKRNIERGDKNE